MNKIFIISISLILMISILMPIVHAEYPVTKNIDIQGSIWNWVPVKIVTAPENYPTDYYPMTFIESGIFRMDTPFNSEAYIERYFDIPSGVSTLSMEVWGALNMGGWCGDPVTTTISLIDSNNNIYQLGYFAPVQRNNNTGPGEIKNFDLGNFVSQRIKIRIDQTSNGKACTFGNYKDIRLLTTSKPIKNPLIDRTTVLGPFDGNHRYFIHLFNVDDVENATVNGKIVLTTGYGQNGWAEIILINGDNIIELTDENGIYDGWTYGFEIRQDDSNIIWSDVCGMAGVERSQCMNNDGTQGIVYRNIIRLKISTPINSPTVASPTINIPTVVNPTVNLPIFRVGPTINLRPVKDEISKTEDGLIELYMDNPSLNDVVMCADVRISVPSGISVYGQGFGDAGSAGVLHGTFDISPGKARTIQMTVKAEKTGEFLIKFSGLYWPGDNKDAFQPISLTHNFKVRDMSTPKVVPTIITKDDKDPVIEGFRTFIKNILDFLNNIFDQIG